VSSLTLAKLCSRRWVSAVDCVVGPCDGSTFCVEPNPARVGTLPSESPGKVWGERRTSVATGAVGGGDNGCKPERVAGGGSSVEKTPADAVVVGASRSEMTGDGGTTGITPSRVLPMRRVPGPSIPEADWGNSAPQRTQRRTRSSLGLSQAGQTSMATYYTRPGWPSKPRIVASDRRNLPAVWPKERRSCNGKSAPWSVLLTTERPIALLQTHESASDADFEEVSKWAGYWAT
jgi:hypothetical protein